MEIQYEDKGNGELLIRDPATKRSLIFHDAYWYLEGKREGRFNIPCYNAPLVDIPERIFEGLYSGIRRWHKVFTKDPKLNVDENPASGFKKSIELLENELVRLLIKDGRADLSWYLFNKEMSHS